MVVDSCPLGHTFDYLEGVCTNCKITLEQHKEQQRRSYLTCECGAEKAGFDSHSHYCPKATK